MICSQCGTNVADGTATCPNCGAQLAPMGAPTGASPGAPPPAQRPPGAAPAFTFNVNRLSQADKITGVATVVLIIAYFLPWFAASANGFTGGSVDAFTGHGWLWIGFIVSLAILAYLVLVAGFEQMPVNLPLGREQLLLGATGLNFVLVLIAFLVKPGTGVTFVSVSVDWQWGAFVGLIAAIVAAAPLAVPAIQARRTPR